MITPYAPSARANSGARPIEHSLRGEPVGGSTDRNVHKAFRVAPFGRHSKRQTTAFTDGTDGLSEWAALSSICEIGVIRGYSQKQRGPADCAVGPRLAKSIAQFPIKAWCCGWLWEPAFLISARRGEGNVNSDTPRRCGEDERWGSCRAAGAARVRMNSCLAARSI